MVVLLAFFCTSNSQYYVAKSWLDRMSSGFRAMPLAKKAVGLAVGVFLLSRVYNYWDNMRKQANEKRIEEVFKDSFLLKDVLDILKNGSNVDEI